MRPRSRYPFVGGVAELQDEAIVKIRIGRKSGGAPGGARLKHIFIGWWSGRVTRCGLHESISSTVFVSTTTSHTPTHAFLAHPPPSVVSSSRLPTLTPPSHHQHSPLAKCAVVGNLTKPMAMLFFSFESLAQIIPGWNPSFRERSRMNPSNSRGYACGAPLARQLAKLSNR